jgi:hypothetical protein
MSMYTECPREGKKNPNTDVDDGTDFDAAHIIAQRYGLSASVARLVAELAGLGGNPDRTTASGGRTA